MTLFVLFLSAALIFSGNLLAVIFGFGFAILFLSGAYAFIKKEVWTIQIIDSVLSWSYPRWPKSEGMIDLREVREIVVDDRSLYLFITFLDDKTAKVKMCCPGYKLREFLEKNYPDIILTFIEGS